MEENNVCELYRMEAEEVNHTVEWLYEKSRKNLKNLREELGVNQADFAKALGVSRAALSYYENGSRTPDVKFILRVGVLTDCNFDYLLGDSPTMKNQKVDIAKELLLSEKEADNLRRLCEFSPAFRALLSSGKLFDISSRLTYSAEDIIAGREDYQRIIWECMKDVEQLFEKMLFASIEETKKYKLSEED